MKKGLFVSAILLLPVLTYASVSVSGELYGTIHYDYAREPVNVEIVSSRLATLEHEMSYLNTLTSRNMERLNGYKQKSKQGLFRIDESRNVINDLKKALKRQYDVYDDIGKDMNILETITNTSEDRNFKNNILEGRRRLREIARYLIKLDDILKDNSRMYDGAYRNAEYKKISKGEYKYNECLAFLAKSFSDFYVTSEVIGKQLTENLRDSALEELKFLQDLKVHNDELKREVLYVKKNKLDKNLRISKFEKINKIKSDVKLEQNFVK